MSEGVRLVIPLSPRLPYGLELCGALLSLPGSIQFGTVGNATGRRHLHAMDSSLVGVDVAFSKATTGYYFHIGILLRRHLHSNELES
mmetsp:Transcript_28451/g.40640  ORF Transcript_28451/g.40640 Transcript_28451/m.40640 type:complete len:87 (+) Transcript_28451:420-680(+)